MSWTLQELRQRVEEALHVKPTPSSDRRVSGVPNDRTIRYYTTRGLVDKPESEGGQAYYKHRHLLQLMAIKRLQSEGLSLEDIGESLRLASDRTLAKYADLPGQEALDQARGELGRFWSRQAAPANAGQAPNVIQGLELQPGTFLTFKTCRDLVPEDVAKINAAAKPLLETLHERGLVP